MTSIFKLMGILFLLSVTSLAADESDCCQEESFCRGKVDIGPAYVHVDILKSGKTDHRMDMPAVKAEFNYRFWKCLVIRPSFLWGKSGSKDSIFNGGVGLGAFIPINKQFSLSPVVGINFGYLKTHYDLAHPLIPQPVHVEEKFQSSSPYLALELSWTFIPTWRLVANYQYSWSRTHTTIKPFVKERSHSEGSSYSAMIEHDLNKNWSINLGGAYNESLTKEKHGLRAYGFKLGVAYWF
ncbi:MAG: porin family protein [Parachlamydia sp.]|nr:porin family protein [Parachlamydia sp.]